jgi:TENA/THI-4/PQQC family
MSFAECMLTEDLEPLRERLLFHPLWTGIEQGTLPHETLRVFALQDWWLVREAYRLDALAVAAMPYLDLQELLLAKLAPKIGGYRLLRLVTVSVMSTHLVALLQEVLCPPFSIENLADLCATVCRTFRVCTGTYHLGQHLDQVLGGGSFCLTQPFEFLLRLVC